MTVAFALSGGGNLGPMQAGAVVALLEAGITPDLLVGTSVGALNAAFLSSRPGLSGAHSLVDGWATLRSPDESPDALVARADAAMYQSKMAGNGSVVHVPMAESSNR
jgi:NTE family protein